MLMAGARRENDGRRIFPGHHHRRKRLKKTSFTGFLKFTPRYAIFLPEMNGASVNITAGGSAEPRPGESTLPPLDQSQDEQQMTWEEYQAYIAEANKQGQKVPLFEEHPPEYFQDYYDQFYDDFNDTMVNETELEEQKMVMGMFRVRKKSQKKSSKSPVFFFS